MRAFSLKETASIKNIFQRSAVKQKKGQRASLPAAARIRLLETLYLD